MWSRITDYFVCFSIFSVSLFCVARSYAGENDCPGNFGNSKIDIFGFILFSMLMFYLKMDRMKSVA